MLEGLLGDMPVSAMGGDGDDLSPAIPRGKGIDKC